MLDESALVRLRRDISMIAGAGAGATPDDEVLACEGLSRWRSCGAVVHTVVVTDGAAQGDGEVRRQESVEERGAWVVHRRRSGGCPIGSSFRMTVS